MLSPPSTDSAEHIWKTPDLLLSLWTQPPGLELLHVFGQTVHSCETVRSRTLDIGTIKGRHEATRIPVLVYHIWKR